MIEETATTPMYFDKPLFLQIPNILVDDRLVTQFINEFVPFRKHESRVLSIDLIQHLQYSYRISL